METRTTSAHSSGVPRVGPAGLPRYGCGVPLKAAAGQATTIKLQTKLMVKCLCLSLPLRQFLPRFLRIRAFDLLENDECRLCIIGRLRPLAELVERQAHVE